MNGAACVVSARLSVESILWLFLVFCSLGSGLTFEIRNVDDSLDSADAETKLVVKTSSLTGAGTSGKVVFTFFNSQQTPSSDIELPRNPLAQYLDINQLSFPAGSKMTFDVTDETRVLNGNITRMELINNHAKISQHHHGEWRPELVTVRQPGHADAVFPIDRHLDVDKRYQFYVYDTHLPQNDPYPKQRQQDLKLAKRKYEYNYFRENFPPMIKKIPKEEKQSLKYMVKQVKDLALQLVISQLKKLSLDSPNWNLFEDIEKVYTHSITKPKYIKGFRDDVYFGRQRVQGPNPVLIHRIKRIPKKFGVKQTMISKKRLDGMTLKKALADKKIFMTDLVDLDGFAEEYKRNVTAPMALFYLNKEENLIPIAIQLFQKKAATNPVFTPDDEKNTWLLAKFYYHLGECTHHQSITHLGTTHFLLEPIAICANRNLARSHPVFRLLKPHFHYTFAINKMAYKSFAKEGNFVDKAMTAGSDTLNLIGKAPYKWNLTRDATIKNLFYEHKVTKKDLPYYPFRDDVLDLYDAIEEYVKTVLKLYYSTGNDSVRKDSEIQKFRSELTRSKEKKGLGFKGVPGNDDKGFSNVDEICETVTGIIFTASVKHATVNFLTYDVLAYPPNYPIYLSGEIPTDKRHRTEGEILSYMPNKYTLLDIMLVGKFLSYRATNSLGDFEVPRLYHPVADDAVKVFQQRLKVITSDIERRNSQRPLEYPWSNPDIIPNAVSA